MSLFDTRPGPVHAGDPETAHQAAADAAKRAPAMRQRALLELASAQNAGLTDWELSIELGGILRTTAGKRRGELVTLGYVVDTPERRPTDTGSSAVVWVCTAEGHKAALHLLAVGSLPAASSTKQAAPASTGTAREAAAS